MLIMHPATSADRYDPSGTTGVDESARTTRDD
jgi:hypothetical protein